MTAKTDLVRVDQEALEIVLREVEALIESTVQEIIRP